MLAACANDNYKITVKIADGVNIGDTIYLMTLENNKPTMLAKSPKSGGGFSLSGFSDTARMCNLVSYYDNKITHNVELFVEQGDINVEIGELRNNISGTKLNNALQEFKDSIDIITALYNEYNQKSKRENISHEALKEARKVMLITSMVRRQYVEKFIKKNIDNPISLYILRNNFETIAPQDGLNIISELPSEYQNDKSIRVISRTYEALLKSSVGLPYVDFEQRDIEGRVSRLSQFAGKGRVVLLNFWASDNVMSLDEQEAVRELKEKYGDRLTIIGISLDNNAEQWRNTIIEHKLDWLQFTDMRGWENEALVTYGVNTNPYNIVIDNDGIIVKRSVRVADAAKQIEAVFAR